jgi:ribonuclease BN (tRNA processing enzyme)
MKLTILGTAPGKSLLGKSHSAYLLEKGSQKILIDCGEGTTQNILAKNLAHDELDYIIISHLHPDHISGIFMLLQTLYLNKRSKDLLLFLPESVREFKSFLNTIYVFSIRFSYDISIQLYNEDSFAELGIYPFRNKHLLGYKNIVEKDGLSNNLLSYSFIIKGNKRNLLLSSDLRSADDISEHITRSDVLILDGIHPSCKSIKELLKESNIEVYITHGDYPLLQQKFAEVLSDKIKLAKENDEIDL